MKAADRRKVAEQIQALAGFPVGVGWLAHYHDEDCYAMADTATREIFISLPLWRKSDQAERADTVAHEIAHLTASSGHNAAWARAFIKLLPKAQKLEWP